VWGRPDDSAHDSTQILGEALGHERATLREYYNLLALVVDKSVWLEEYAREQITLEEQHIAEVDKMMRKPASCTPPVMSGRTLPRCSCGWGNCDGGRRRRARCRAHARCRVARAAATGQDQLLGDGT